MPASEVSSRARAPRISGWQDGSQAVARTGQAARQDFEPTAQEYLPPICRSFWPAVLRVAQRFILWGQMRDDVHARGIEPDEERLPIFLGLVHKIYG